jgi:hypothetical protein
MKFSRTKTPAEQLNRMEALACVPVISPGLQWRKAANGEVLIEYPLQIKPFLQSLFARLHPQEERAITRKLQLDAMGSKVWLMLDGRTNVKEIITRFAAATTLSLQEAEQSVTLFLRDLGRRGLIILQ